MAYGGMKKTTKVIVALLLMPLGVVIPFLSLESHYAPPIKAQAQDSALEQRIKNYKLILTKELLKSELEKIQLRCDVAQTNAETIAARVDKVQKDRSVAYDIILKRLNAIQKRLSAQAFETSSLEENIQVLDGKISDFNNTMSDYSQTLDDLVALDCKADPSAFRATLLTARKHHDRLLPMVGDIRTYITNTIKPTLQQIRKQIESGNTVGGEKL